MAYSTQTPTGAAPYGYDQWGNALPAPGQWTQGGQPYVPPTAWTQNGAPYVPPAPVLSMPAPGVGPSGPTAQPTNTTTADPNAGTGGPSAPSLPSGPTTDLTAPWTGVYTPPTPQALPNAPVFQPPAYTPPPAFSYGDFQAPGAFVAPTAADAANEPGYQFAQGQANDAFMNSKAASGTASTGGTIKDFLNFNQAAAAQQYTNVWNRANTSYNQNFTNALNTYSTNRGNAVDAYNTNYKTQYQDPWNMADLAATQQFAPQTLAYTTQSANTQHQNDINNNNVWNAYLNSYDVFKDQRDSVFDKQFKVATA